MKSFSSKNVTDLILAWGNGDEGALDEAVPLVYEELRRLAARYMQRENPAHTLQTTALVHEAYCKLVDQRRVRWQNRAHFMGIAAQLMRRILIDHARSHARAKRGGGARKISLDETLLIPQQQAADLISLDEALTRLAQFDARKSRIVEMKFFGGLSEQEIAEVEKVSTRTVEREWRKARAWLHHEISPAKTK